MNKKLSKKANNTVLNILEFTKNNNIDSEDEYLLFYELKTVISNIERIKREFESTMFFVVTAGAIKSGKSTLINLLAHKEVSTTKQGKETTLRPAIISSGKEDKILLFNTSKSEQDSIKVTKVNDLAIDYIKGFISKGELNTIHKIKVTEKSLTQANLETYLTSPIIEGEDEPKLINIQVKISPQYKTSLLNHDIAIIDTPGIDGIIAGAEGKKDTKHKLALMERVDLMLFLQSSITPINKESKEYILNLSKEHSITNMSLVHNKFTLKPWRKKLGIESQTVSEEYSITSAKNLFKDIVVDMKTHVVDFAKAEDGFFYEKDELVKESKFEEFEKSLFENIMLNRQELQEERVYNSLQKLIDENINDQNTLVSIKTIKEKIVQQETQWKDEENQFIDKICNLQQYFHNNVEIIRLVDAVQDSGQAVDDGWELNETLNYVQSESFPTKLINISKGDKSSKILVTLEEIAEQENKDLQNRLNNVTTFNNYVSHYQLTETESISQTVECFNRLRTDLQIEPFSLKLDMQTSCQDIKINPDDIYRNIKDVWDNLPWTSLNDDQITKLKKDTREEIRKGAKSLVEDFRINLHEKIKSQFKDYHIYLESKKGECNKKLSDKRKNKMQQMRKTKELVQKLEDFFMQLQEEI